MKKFRSASLALFMLWFSTALAAGETHVMTLTDGWVRAMPPGMKMTAAFGTLANAGAEPLQLVAWDSDAFSDVSLHRTQIVDGVSKMREVGTLELAPGEKLEMEPGGYHLMLMSPVADAADTLVIGVSTAGGQHFEFEVPVKKR